MKGTFSSVVVVICTLVFVLPAAYGGPQIFPTPEAAGTAFISAIRAHDRAALGEVLGSSWKKYIPVEGIEREDIDAFLAAADRSNSIVPLDENSKSLSVGTEGWTLPIPIVADRGGWTFDVKAGAEEIRTRRIGRNELAAIKAALAYYDAQREYAQVDRNGDDIKEYAQRIFSTTGHKDGLYWHSENGEDESPLGPHFGGKTGGSDYHGYHFRILTAQGAHAVGGAYDYLIGGRLTGGFAMVAWPADYGDTGIMTFMVNHDGQVYQRDFGKRTASAVRRIKAFDPDASWTSVEPPE